jgi:hypothetical protein
MVEPGPPKITKISRFFRPFEKSVPSCLQIAQQVTGDFSAPIELRIQLGAIGVVTAAADQNSHAVQSLLPALSAVFAKRPSAALW